MVSRLKDYFALAVFCDKINKVEKTLPGSHIVVQGAIIDKLICAKALRMARFF
jgi:hypothetical protein